MQTRRNIFGLAFAFLFCRRSTKGQTRAAARELARQELTGPQAGMEAILVEVTAPAGPSMAHRHPGFVLGYVLDGEMRFAINGRSEKTIKTGETFFEPVGALHTMGSSARPDASVRFLAFIVAPKGSPATLPA